VKRARKTLRSSPKRSSKSTGKLYKIYDLANNGRLLKVRKDDPRYLEEDEALMAGTEPRYPHRKPSKATKQKFAVGEVIGRSPLLDAALSPTAKTLAGAAIVAKAPSIVKAIPKALRAATKIPPQAIGTAIGLLARYSVAGMAGLGSYFATKWILENFPTKQRRLDAAADAYRKARRDLASELGRDLTKDELAALALNYKQVVADIQRWSL
jgi:hypothetical protein